MPSWITAQLVVSVVTIAVMIHVMLICVAYFVMMERKVSAYIQDRIGPNRVGFDFGLPALKFLKGCIGLGQPLADGVKFILKEDYTPNRVDKVLFTLAPIIVVVPAMIGFLVIPWGGVWECPDIHIPVTELVIAGGPVNVAGAVFNAGIVYLLAVASLGVYGVTLGGWAGNNKFSFLGGLRATAQMISYEIPMGLALLAALLVYGTFRTDSIIQQQVDSGWLIFSQPLVAVIFFITGLAEANRAPFDNAEAEQELVGGYHTEYSSMRFALFFLAEYSHLFTSAAFFSLIFLGGYAIPGVALTDPASTSLLAVIVKLLAFMSKVVVIVFLGMVVRWSIPRLRYDQVMMVAWQGLIPLSLGLVLVNSVLVYFNMATLVPLLLGNVALAVVTLAFAPLLKQSTVNRRIPLYGSRFSPMPGEAVQTAPTHPMARADG
ncbi:MAG: complex I subunit 1/NuoH family protein [Phycisphaerales bacterium]|jgi:NADH-quinone oxidoreductase subunit H